MNKNQAHFSSCLHRASHQRFTNLSHIPYSFICIFISTPVRPNSKEGDELETSVEEEMRQVEEKECKVEEEKEGEGKKKDKQEEEEEEE